MVKNRRLLLAIVAEYAGLLTTKNEERCLPPVHNRMPTGIRRCIN